jgi:acid phosphatase (class A)
MLALAGPACTAGTVYLDATPDLTRYLAPPPAAGSAADRRDIAEVLAVQAARTEAEATAAQADQAPSVFRFADVLGPWFTAERLPLTDALAARACREASGATAAAKAYWRRPRPYVASDEVKPVISHTTQGSYPSGHATCGQLWAIVLAELVPEQRAALFERGHRYGWNRVIGGVHYPSDVEAGRTAAAVIAAALFANPAFQADLAATRAELRTALAAGKATATGPQE